MGLVNITRAGAILSVADVWASRDFYTENFGFSVEQQYEDPPYVILVSGGTRLSLSRAGNSAEDLRGFSQFPPEAPESQATMLVFEVEDCGASWEALTLAGVRVVSSVFRPPWGGGRFFVVDPDNYLIEVEELA